jgi:hypothetical protein
LIPNAGIVSNPWLLPLLVLKSLIANPLASVVLRRSSHHDGLIHIERWAFMRRRRISAWFLWLMRTEVLSDDDLQVVRCSIPKQRTLR